MRIVIPDSEESGEEETEILMVQHAVTLSMRYGVFGAISIHNCREEEQRTPTSQPQTLEEVARLVQDKISDEEFPIIVNRETIFDDTLTAVERITFSPHKKVTVS